MITADVGSQLRALAHPTPNGTVIRPSYIPWAKLIVLMALACLSAFFESPAQAQVGTVLNCGFGAPYPVDNNYEVQPSAQLGATAQPITIYLAVPGLSVQSIEAHLLSGYWISVTMTGTDSTQDAVDGSRSAPCQLARMPSNFGFNARDSLILFC